MILKLAIAACLVALVHAGTIHQRNIPVEIKYDEAASDGASVTNVEDKSEAAESTTQAAAITEESSTVGEQNINAIRNLDEKVQLSPEDLGQAAKHLPVVEDISVKGLDTSVSEPVESERSNSLQSGVQQAEDIICNGLKNLRNSFKAENDQLAPSPQQWDEFEKSVNEYLGQEKRKLQLKQNQPPQNQNIFQNIAQGFQTVANNFVQNLVGQNPISNSTNQGDEQQGGQQQGPFQGFVNFFQTGVNNLVGSINSLGNQGSTTSNTVLGDIGTASTQAPGFVSSFVNNVQQFFGQIQGAAQGIGQNAGGSPGAQGDPGTNNTSSGSPSRPGQIIQSIGSAINQFIQGRPPNTSGDEGSGTTEANVNIIQSIGNVIQNSPLNPLNSPLNPFRPTQQPAQGGSTPSNPIQAGISGAQNIGSQIQQLIPGQASSTESSKKEDQAAADQSNKISEAPSSSQTVPEKPKDVNSEPAKNEDEEKKDQPAKPQEEIKDEVKKDKEQDNKEMGIKKGKLTEEIREEQLKAEEVEKQMEEEVKKEEINEELMKEKVEKEKKQSEEKKEEILMPVE